MTNGDKIRNMTDEELLEIFDIGCYYCEYRNIDNSLCPVIGDDNKSCEDGILKWLKKEVE